MTGDADLIGHLADDFSNLHQKFLTAWIQVRAARGEHVDLVLIHDLDANALGRIFDKQAARQWREIGHAADLLFQVLLHLFKL